LVSSFFCSLVYVLLLILKLNNMKIFFKIPLISFTFFILSSCGSAKDKNTHEFQEYKPFKILEATYNSTLDEQIGKRSIHIEITIDNPNIKLDAVYFRNSKSELKLETNSSNQLFVGNIYKKRSNKDYNLAIDSTKEFGNVAPDISSKIPFELKKNEAVVSYYFKDKKYYFKIRDLQEI
jgi:hypothetical protein